VNIKALFLNKHISIHALLVYSSVFFSETFNITPNVIPGLNISVQSDTGSIYLKTHNKPKIEWRVTVENGEGNKFSIVTDCKLVGRNPLLIPFYL